MATRLLSDYESKRDINIDHGLMKPKPFNDQLMSDINNKEFIEAVGYGIFDEDEDLQRVKFDRRPVTYPDDVVIDIKYCGVCHSDWHVICNEWKGTKYPMIVGHEVTGIVVKVGPQVKKFKVGDRVAMGPNYNSCLNCQKCKQHYEQYCENGTTEIYNKADRYPDDIKTKSKKPHGPITYGGWSNVIVAKEHFVLKVPDSLPLDRTAPLLCAGITMYTPIKNLGIKPGHRLGIAGIGGLGHMGIKIAHKLGIEVIALTNTPWKVDDAKRLGANDAILMKDPEQLKAYKGTFDFIIDTIPFTHDPNPYIKLLKVYNGATLCVLGALLPMLYDQELIVRTGVNVTGSNIGGLMDSQKFLNLCAEKDILPEIKLIRAEDLMSTHKGLMTSKIKYRYVLDNSSLNARIQK